MPDGDVVADGSEVPSLLVTCDVTGTLGDIALVTFDAMTVPLRPHRRAKGRERSEATWFHVNPMPKSGWAEKGVGQHVTLVTVTFTFDA
jgi:hypothetical protein